jgi:hypothetical protein
MANVIFNIIYHGMILSTLGLRCLVFLHPRLCPLEPCIPKPSNGYRKIARLPIVDTQNPMNCHVLNFKGFTLKVEEGLEDYLKKVNLTPLSKVQRQARTYLARKGY